ncbi:hypothetical protein HY732_04485 [Candidatus Uhrbacteria bacterium]|nr:hypothetical protein [Candidatus Uhrbacteria bacterium]
MPRLFDKNSSFGSVSKRALFSALFFVGVLTAGFLFFSQPAVADICVRGQCLDNLEKLPVNANFGYTFKRFRPSTACNDSIYAHYCYNASDFKEGLGSGQIGGDTQYSKGYCDTTTGANGKNCATEYEAKVTNTTGPLCIKGRCYDPFLRPTIDFTINDQKGTVVLLSPEIHLKWTLQNAESVEASCSGYCPPNMDEVRNKTRYDIHSGWIDFYNNADAVWTLRAYHGAVYAEDQVSVKIDPAIPYGICMNNAREQAREAANNDWAAKAGCFGLQYGAELGIKALTGGAPMVGDIAGGIVGGLCDTGVILYKLRGYTEKCAAIYTPPDKTPEEQAIAFLSGFAKEFGIQLITGFFQGLFGQLFDNVKCIPFFGSIISFAVNFIGAGIGNFIGNLITGGLQLDRNDPMVMVGGAIGGPVGKAIGGEIGRKLGGNIAALLNFANVKPDGVVQCPESSEPKKYACILGACTESPIGVSKDQCDKDCKPPPTIDIPAIPLPGGGSLEIGGGITKLGLSLAGFVSGKIQAIDCVAKQILIAEARPGVFGNEPTGKKDSSGKDIVKVRKQYDGQFTSTSEIKPMAYLAGYVPGVFEKPGAIGWDTVAWDMLNGVGLSPEDSAHIIAQTYEYEGTTKTFTNHIISCFVH